ncbi:MBL fold metallo-hydrolase [Amycolatopsis thermoflava]|uniref:MBL fold metallo-hydrolase n=1 Tax=Amycolatopsis thermoflava TaxID=84480 RepID=UPI003EBE09AF
MGIAPEEIAPGVHRLRLGRRALASNVYFIATAGGWALVDAGWASSAPAIRAAAASLFGQGNPPRAILLTHIHPNHSGAAGTLARQWHVQVHVAAAELPMARGRYLPAFGMPLDRWAVVPLLRLLPARVRNRIETAGDISDVTHAFGDPADLPGLPGWTAVPTPGHTPGHVAYHRADGVLLSGDAALTVDLDSLTGVVTARRRLAGPPRYTTWNPVRARHSLAGLAALRPRLLAPGHGDPVPVTGDELAALATRLTWWQHAARPQASTSDGDYRPPPRLYTHLQGTGRLLTRLGLTPRDVVTLEVPGRRTGTIRRTTLLRTDHDGAGHLVSITGESEWVRNVRAAGGRAVLARGRRKWPVLLTEIPVGERAPVIRAQLLRTGRRPGSARVAGDALAFFGITGEPGLAEIAEVAHRHPVFRIGPRAAG